MTTSHVTTSEAPVRVPQLMATLLLLQAEHKLPDPVHMYATLSTGCADFDVVSRSDLEAWHEVTRPGFHGEIRSRSQTLDGVDYDIHHFTVRRWGWFIEFSAQVPVTTNESEQLPAETLAVLAEVAA